MNIFEIFFLRQLFLLPIAFYPGPRPILKWVICCFDFFCVLYIPDINPLSDTQQTKILSPMSFLFAQLIQLIVSLVV